MNGLYMNWNGWHSQHWCQFDLLRPRWNGHQFSDDTFKSFPSMKMLCTISIKFSLNFLPKGTIDNKLALVQIMAWCIITTKDAQVYWCHYTDVIMGTMASQITSLTIVYSTIYSDADQRKHQSSAALAFVRGIHHWPVNSRTKGQ